MNCGIKVTDDNTNTLDQLLSAYVTREIQTYDWEDVQHFIYTPKYLTRKRKQNSSVWETVYEDFGFDVIPASLQLSLVDLQMSMASNNNSGGRIYSYYLYDLIECIKQNADYDYIIFDCAPALSALSINAMTASIDGVIVPTNLDVMSFRGISTLKESVDFVQESSKARGIEHAGILGILLLLYSSRRVIDKALEEYLREFYPLSVFSNRIRESSDARRANAEGLMFAQINKKANDDYTNLAKEIEFAIEEPEKWKEQNNKFWDELLASRNEGK